MAFRLGTLFRSKTRGWYGPFARPYRIITVTVRDQDYRLIRVLDSQRDLAAFRELWAALIEVDRGSYG
jgi:hypothetical protein